MKEFLTFKSGKFYFSDIFDEVKINNLLVRAAVLNEIVAELPILPELSSRLEPDIMYSSISGTAMIQAAVIMGTKTWPPIRGVGVLWTLRMLGWSTRPFLMAYWITSGVTASTANSTAIPRVRIIVRR